MPPQPPPLTDEQQALVVAHRPLAQWVLSRHFYLQRRGLRRDPVTWDALQGAAVVGLVDAARRYNPDYRTKAGRPVAFSTFAKHTIWGTINKVAAKRIIEEAVTKVNRIGDMGDGSPFETFVDPTMPEPIAFAERAEATALAIDMLRFLSPVDAKIISHRFGLNGAEQLDNAQIGELLGITRVRVKERFTRAIERFRTHYCIRINALAAA